MKKRIEKVVECVKIGNHITVGNSYTILFERGDYCYITNDKGNIDCCGKQYFKIVSEKEVLEFEGRNLDLFGESQYSLEVISKVDLWNYDIKVIATPKDKTYEDMSKEELIKMLKSGNVLPLKSKE